MGKVDKTVIICDSCGSDISPVVTSYPHDYILKLSVIDRAHHLEFQAIYSILITPPIETDMYFCSLKCLKNNMNHE